MIKRFTRKVESVSMAALIIGVFSLASKFLGILRDHLLAKNFGATAELDVYYAAFRLPDLVMNLLILGIVSAGLIPVMSRFWQNKETKDKFWSLLNNLVNLYLLVFIGISIIFFIFMAPIMRVLTPGFSPEQMTQVVSLTRWMFLSPLLLGLSSIFGSGVQVHRQFVLYSLAPFLYNIGIIFGLVMLVPVYGIKGVVFGVITGAILHLLIQWSGMYHLGYRYRFHLNIYDKNVWHLLKLAFPRFLTLGLGQINFIIITAIASTLEEGSLSIFNFANNLQALPLSLFGISFAIASFPMLSRYFQKKDWENFYDLFFETLKQILFFLLPLTVVFILLRAQIVRLVLGAGKFDWQDTILTMETLGLFALSLFAQSLLPLFVRAFYAIENTVIPFLISLAGTILNVFLSYLLINCPVPEVFHNYLQSKTLGVLGLALAFSIANIFQLGLFWIILKKKLLYKTTKYYKLWLFLLKNFIAVIFLGLGLQLGKWLWGQVFDLSEAWQVLGQISLSSLFGGIFFYIIMKILKVQEFLYWEGKVLKKIKSLLYAKTKRS